MSNLMDFSGGKGLEDDAVVALDPPAEQSQSIIQDKLQEAVESGTEFGVVIKDMIIESGINPAAAAGALVANLCLLITFATQTVGEPMARAMVNRIFSALNGAIDNA